MIRRTVWLTPIDIQKLEKFVTDNMEVCKDIDSRLTLEAVAYECSIAILRFEKTQYPKRLRASLGFKNNEVPLKLSDTEIIFLTNKTKFPIELSNKLIK